MEEKELKKLTRKQLVDIIIGTHIESDGTLIKTKLTNFLLRETKYIIEHQPYILQEDIVSEIFLAITLVLDDYSKIEIINLILEVDDAYNLFFSSVKWKVKDEIYRKSKYSHYGQARHKQQLEVDKLNFSCIYYDAIINEDGNSTYESFVFDMTLSNRSLRTGGFWRSFLYENWGELTDLQKQVILGKTPDITEGERELIYQTIKRIRKSLERIFVMKYGSLDIKLRKKKAIDILNALNTIFCQVSQTHMRNNFIKLFLGNQEINDLMYLNLNTVEIKAIHRYRSIGEGFSDDLLKKVLQVLYKYDARIRNAYDLNDYEHQFELMDTKTGYIETFINEEVLRFELSKRKCLKKNRRLTQWIDKSIRLEDTEKSVKLGKILYRVI